MVIQNRRMASARERFDVLIGMFEDVQHVRASGRVASDTAS